MTDSEKATEDELWTETDHYDSDQPKAQSLPDEADVFDEMGVDEIDGEALWDELAAESNAETLDHDGSADPEWTDREDFSKPTPSDSADERLEQPDRTGSRQDDPDRQGDDVRLIDKRVYCQQCPYFTEPPDVDCTHKGTSIMEIIKDGRFRVDSCPVITESGPDQTILDGGS